MFNWETTKRRVGEGEKREEERKEGKRMKRGRERWGEKRK